MLQKMLMLLCLSILITGCGRSTESSSDSTNNAPTVSSITVVDRNGGGLAVGDILEGEYTYSDPDGDAEGNSLYQWLRAPNTSSMQQGSFVAIPGANSKTYMVTEGDIGYRLMLQVTPVAQTGETQGVATTPDPANPTDTDSITEAVTQSAAAPETDTTPPIITILGDNPAEVIQGSVYTDAGATTTDDVDADGTATASGTVDADVLGTYTINYNATDAVGNNALLVSRTVNVIAAPATLARAHRLLLQTTFGPIQEDLDRVQSIGTTAWIDEQLAKPSAYDSDSDGHKTHLERTMSITEHAEPDITWVGDSGVFNKDIKSAVVSHYQMAAWWENAIGLHPTNTLHGSDQLRQRVAYALSQLLVTSTYEAPLHQRAEGIADYYDILASNAFGNYRDLLGEVARSPAMGIYLSHQGNRKADPATGTRPDENFAREIMQLFTVGLYELNNDGTANRDGDPATSPDAGEDLVPTYSQTDIEELAKVMTGWDLVNNTQYGKRNAAQGDYTKPMEFTPAEHEEGMVTVLGTSFSLTSGADNSGMDAALDVLFNHPNIGPYVSKHLIMRLVTSNPSAGYIGRVAAVFTNDGAGVRGNLKAVIRAILVDNEARNDTIAASTSFGKFKEPLLAWTQMLRATGAVPMDGWKARNGTSTVSGVYWSRNPQNYLGQAAMRSPSVFNFYSADYAPSDSNFADNNLVAPEMKIQTDQVILEYNNRLLTLLGSYEKNKITIQDDTPLATYIAANRKYSNDPLMLVNFDTELAIVKQALGGDYENIDNANDKENAVDALLSHLDRLLLGETMTAEYQAALKEYLINANGLRNNDNFRETLNIVRNAIRMMITSSAYMVQK